MYNIRCLRFRTVRQAAEELSRLGVHLGGVRRMASKAVFLVLRLKKVPGRSAIFARLAMLRAGAEAIFDVERALAGEEVPVVVMGPLKQLAAARVALVGCPRPEAADLASALAVALRAAEAAPRPPHRLGDHSLRLGSMTYVVGVLNATPDSFSGDGTGGRLEGGIARGLKMASEGADLVEVGGQSTREGADEVPEEEEMTRVIPLVRALAEHGLLVSIDTSRSRVALQAAEAGAVLVNDPSGLADPEMAGAAARTGLPLVITHTRGTPKTMRSLAHYDDLMGELSRFFRDRMGLARRAGVADDRLILDPGIGFAKTPSHNLEVLRNLEQLSVMGMPLMIGPSRKPLTYESLRVAPVDRDLETLAAVVVAVAAGVDFVRVHDVARLSRAVRLADAVVRGWHDPGQAEAR